jgi:hypothetical protein
VRKFSDVELEGNPSVKCKACYKTKSLAVKFGRFIKAKTLQRRFPPNCTMSVRLFVSASFDHLYILYDRKSQRPALHGDGSHARMSC